MRRNKRQITIKNVPELKKFRHKKIRTLTMLEVHETGKLEIQKKATDKSPERKVSFPKEKKDQFQMMPDEFQNVQNALDALNLENRQVTVAGDSLESYFGYDSLLRIMNKYFHRQYSFYRSKGGGELSPEEARKAVYRKGLNDEEAVELFDQLMRKSTDRIGFWELMELHDNCPAMAQNLWEMIKRAAGREFESGHRAAAVFEPVDYMTDAWNRASYIGIRESFVEEWQPKGGIELSMIDTITQAWLQLQYWTEQSVLRAKTRPREENPDFQRWKGWTKQKDATQWNDGFWDPPRVSEQAAVEQAAQMADRWQRMYFRAIRALRDWRRYTPQVTINNPQQVNIAADGGQQINVAKTAEQEPKRIIK